MKTPVVHFALALLRPGAVAFFAFLTAAAAPAQNSSFTPNDPYFFPDVSGNATQPGYYGQWHLKNSMTVNSTNAGLDVNIWGAWQRGLTGNGVVISIVPITTPSTVAGMGPS